MLGLYERFLYWTIGRKNFVKDDFPLDNDLPSLEYLYLTRLQISYGVYEFDQKALNYIQPILSDMRSNSITPQVSFEIPHNKRAGDICQ